MSTPSSEPVRPFIPASQSFPEITVKAVILGAILAAVLGGANAYLGLKVGITVSASIPAAVISMAILRLFKNSNILENNIVQTSASAGESLAAGVIFTFPALIILQYWSGFSYLETMAIAALGGVLGVLFTIPLRRALILESKLQFPEGVATGEVLKVGSAGGKDIRALAVAGIGGALIKLAQTGFKALAGSAHGSVSVGKSIFGFGSDLSVALLAVGYIVRLNIATLVFAGGMISWFIAIPIYSALYGAPDGLSGYGAAEQIWNDQIRYLGVGAMIVGGLWALIALFKPIRSGIRSSMEAVRQAREGKATDIPRTERDTPINFVFIGTIALAIPMFLAFILIIDQEALGISSGLYWTTLLLGLVFSIIAGFLFSSVAGYMAGLVGSSNNPISGVTIATILTISLILLALLGSQIDFAVSGSQALAAAATAILVGAIVCCAAAIAGDNMQDLKAGQIVGATPYKQQIMQVIGVVAGAIAIAPVLQLLFEAYGLGGVFPREGMSADEMLAAPQATLMASVAQGVFTQNLPWGMIAIGALIAVGIIGFDEYLQRSGRSFRAPVLAVAVGIYLPLELTVPIFIGGLVAYFADRAVRRKAAGNDDVVKGAERRGLLFSSGLITGEALVGIFLAIPFALAQDTNVWSWGIPSGVADVLGIAVFVGFIYWLYRIAKRAEA